MAPLSRSVLTLKRLVESQLREKDQAAELLKGYVTTITREASLTFLRPMYFFVALFLCFAGGRPLSLSSRSAPNLNRPDQLPLVRGKIQRE